MNVEHNHFNPHPLIYQITDTNIGIYRNKVANYLATKTSTS